jgi:hypothetical protein
MFDYYSEIECESDHDIVDEDDDSQHGMNTLEGEDDDDSMPSNRACEKHRRWKKKCPDSCPEKPRLKDGELGGYLSKRGRKRRSWPSDLAV